MQLRVKADLSAPDSGSPVEGMRRLFLEYTTPAPGFETALYMLDVGRGSVERLVKALTALGIPVVYDPAGNMTPGFKWADASRCVGLGRGATGPACCKHAGKYNGFASDGPLLFECPKSCPCHD